MGRPPCCDKVGVKKGPWTPEEDIMLVSYVQEHGPGNWRSVPTNTGLRRCSKSCRLRWTNYLRPGIRRGDFTDDEEKMIISLQALLGNKWAAIASYLPERTDNDIKNYWNTHLKKKLKKLQMGVSAAGGGDPAENRHDGALSKNSGGLSSTSSSSSSHYISRGQWEKRLQTDINLAKQALNEALSLDKPSNFSSLLFDSPDQFFTKPPPAITRPTTAATTYASSTENIAKLLKGFMKNTPPKKNSGGATVNHHLAAVKSEVNSSSACCNSTNSSVDDGDKTNGGIDLSEAFESLFGFESFDSNSNNNSDFSHQSNYTSPEASNLFQGESKTPPLQLAMFENWLLEEAAAGGGGGCHVHVKTDHLTTNFSFEESAADFFED